MLQESRYILWNEEVREKSMRIWQPNCSARDRYSRCVRPFAPENLAFKEKI